MDERMRCVLRAGPQMEDGKNLGGGVDGQPKPQHLCGAAQPGAQFVQLEMREQEVAEIVLMQGLRVLASASQPAGDGGLSVAEDPLGSGRVQSFGERRQHHSDLLRRGFQTVQGSVPSSCESGVAGLAAKRLDPFSTAMRAIPNQGMNMGSVAKSFETEQ